MSESAGSPVLLLTGAPGSGKTTVARLLAVRSRRAVHLEADSFFHFIQSGYIEPWKPESHEQNTVVMRIVAQAAGGYADAGNFTVVDGIISPRWFLEPVSDSIRARGHSVAYAILGAPLAMCLSRSEERGFGRSLDATVVEQLWREFTDLGPLERHVIDTEEQTPEETAQALSDRLEAGQLTL